MKKLSIFSIMLLLLVACSSAKQTPTPEPSKTALPPTLTYTYTPIPPSDTPVPTDTPIPTATPTPFVPKATIKIASQSPLSLQFSDFGKAMMKGSELAIMQLSGPLMDLGYEVKLALYDDQTDKTVAVNKAKKITADPDVLCVVGPMLSYIVKPVKEIYHQAGLAFISPSDEAPFINQGQYLEVNRLVGGRAGVGMAGAQFAEAQGYSRVFVIRSTDEFSQSSAYYFRDEANRLGIEVFGYITTDIIKEFGNLIDRLMAANTDMVYFSTRNIEQAGTFFREARAAGYTGVFLSNETAPSLLESGGPLVIEDGGLYFISVGAPLLYYPEAASFLDDFETFYNSAPELIAAQAYDATGICVKAIEQASIAKDGEIPTRAEVANAIRSLQDYQGITGTYTFDIFGNPNPARYFVLQVVSPNPANWDQNILFATFDIVLPK